MKGWLDSGGGDGYDMLSPEQQAMVDDPPAGDPHEPRSTVLLSLIDTLTTFKVLVWGESSQAPADGSDREATGVDDSHVVSSLRRADGRHAVVIDVDHPAHLVESTTPGHYHLYIDVPDGIEWDAYEKLLRALADAGVIEPGYLMASIERGHSDVRLPWVKKPTPVDVAAGVA